MKFWSYKDIEKLAEQRLAEYESKHGVISAPPVPLDRIIENSFDLKISWEPIKEINNECILGGLRPDKKQIVLNEVHLDLFKGKPGLENFTKGHELGHWDLFVKKDLIGHPELFNAAGAPFLMRSGKESQNDIRILVANMWRNDEAYKKLAELEKGKDDGLTRRLVDKYASMMCMPTALLRKACKNFDLRKWPNIYEIAGLFNVTPTALRVRLEQMNMIYVDGKTIYRSKEEFTGQLALPSF